MIVIAYDMLDQVHVQITCREWSSMEENTIVLTRSYDFPSRGEHNEGHWVAQALDAALESL